MKARRIHPAWLLPAVVCLFGVVAIVSAHLERERTRTTLEGMTRDHAASVARLVRLSASNAAECTELLAELVRSDLQRAAVPTSGPPNEDIAVRVDLDRSETAAFWGQVPPDERTAFINDMAGRDLGVLIDDGVPARLGLVCLVHSQEAARIAACLGAERFSELRRQSGIGALLGTVAGTGITYIAIQDVSGILASTRMLPIQGLPADDAFLKRVLSAPTDLLEFRRLHDGAASVIEGVGPFDLADGTRAIVRIGIDAAHLERFERQTRTRLGIIMIVVVAVSLVSVLLARLLVKGERSRELAERDLERREEQHRHWRTIGLMSATVAHEVRNPLNTIGIAVQRLGREFDVSPDDRTEFRELLSILSSETDRLNRVVTEFLELGRPLALKRDRQPAEGLIRDALAPLLLRSDREDSRIELDNRCQGEVEVDASRFGQVMANVVGNALDAAGPGGTVRVTAACTDQEMIVEVEDTGPGMDAGAIERAWQPFATTKAHGTGLGLPLARRLIESHGGTINLRSIPGQGTTVTLRLPRCMASSDQGGGHDPD